MTASDPTPAIPGPERDQTPAPGGASWARGNSLGVSPRGCPAPRVAEQAWHQGAPGSPRAAEGGSTRRESTSAPAPRRDADATAKSPRARIRKRKPRQRDRVRSVRLSPEELALIQRAAAAAGMKVAGFIAAAAVSASAFTTRDAATAALIDHRAAVREVVAARNELNRVGNNVNQIAKALNSGSETVSAETALAAVTRIAARLEKATFTLLEHSA